MAAIALIKKLGGLVIEAAFIVNLPDLGGSNKLKEFDVKMFSLTEFKGK